MQNDESREESKHDNDWESDELILPSENPETIEETGESIEITDIFTRECILFFFSSEIIDEGYYWEYKKQSIDNAPDREGEANRRKEVIVFVREFLSCHASERYQNGEGIECHHKNIADEVEKRKFHSETMI